MMTPPSRLPREGRDQRLVDWLNRLRDFMVSSRPLNGEGVIVSQTHQGTKIHADTAGSSPLDNRKTPAVWS